jgi:hypothetical protein
MVSMTGPIHRARRIREAFAAVRADEFRIGRWKKLR